MGDVIYLGIIVTWLVIGALVGVQEARRGHWRWSWLPYAVIGPFALPVAWMQGAHHPHAVNPVVVNRGDAHRGPVDVLVGIDGSDSALTAGLAAMALLGDRVRRVTLATVLDLDTATPHEDSTLYPEPWPEETAARAELELAAAEMGRAAGLVAGSVILAGEPAATLEQYASTEGYEVIVVGCRGKGLSKLVLGSCAERLTHRSSVPVLMIPHAVSVAA